MKTFFLYREEDETGISGTGIVAEGVMFKNGKCAMCWRGEIGSVGIYDDIKDLKKIHGHNGKTKIVWVNPHDTWSMKDN